MNFPNTTHVLEASAEVQDRIATHEGPEWLEASGDADRAIAENLKVIAAAIEAFDSQGQSERAHEAARELAALSIVYMARGLA